MIRIEEQAEDSFAQHMAAIPDCVAVLSTSGEIQFVNSSGALLMEASSTKELIGRNYADLWPPERRPEIIDALRRAAEGEITTVRGHCPTLKGNDRCWETHFSALRNPASNANLQIIGMAREISDTLAYGMRRVPNEKQFSRILEASGDGIYEMDSEGRCTFINSAAARMLGYSTEELIGQPLHETFHHHHADGHCYPLSECPIYQATQNGVPDRVDDEVFWHKDGFAIDVSYSVFPHQAPAARRGAVVTFTDSSERKRAENELRQLASELSEADRRKTEFIATLAHELRNPLAPLRTGLQIIANAGDDQAAVARVRGMMERQLGQMVHLINDLLDVARVSSGKMLLQLQPVELKTILGAAVEASQSLIDAGGHSLSIEMPAAPVRLDADTTRLTQVFTNLLNNAAKYTPGGGRISINVTTAEGTVRIVIADSGIGLPTKSLSQIFEMFTRVGTSASGTHEGLGIGLNLVRRLVELHGGYVVARSKGPGHGSAFIVTLPLADSAAALEHEAPYAAAPAVATAIAIAIASGRDTPLRIMLVDDNVDAAQSLSMLLEGDRHRTFVANSGRDALLALAEFKPEIIFLDIGMPEMNGYEVAHAIRSMPGAGSPFLVALTGWGGTSDRERTQRAGFDAHLTKPADLALIGQLLASVRSAV